MNRVLFLLALIAAPLAGAQAPARSAPRNSGQYTISGVMVNAVTGQPLDRADVSLHLPMVDTLVAETTTGEDGHFTFEHLAKGQILSYCFTARLHRSGL